MDVQFALIVIVNDRCDLQSLSLSLHDAVTNPNHMCRLRSTIAVDKDFSSHPLLAKPRVSASDRHAYTMLPYVEHLEHTCLPQSILTLAYSALCRWPLERLDMDVPLACSNLQNILVSPRFMPGASSLCIGWTSAETPVQLSRILLEQNQFFYNQVL